MSHPCHASVSRKVISRRCPLIRYFVLPARLIHSDTGRWVFTTFEMVSTGTSYRITPELLTAGKRAAIVFFFLSQRQSLIDQLHVRF